MLLLCVNRQGYLNSHLKDEYRLRCSNYHVNIKSLLPSTYNQSSKFSDLNPRNFYSYHVLAEVNLVTSDRQIRIFYLLEKSNFGRDNCFCIQGKFKTGIEMNCRQQCIKFICKFYHKGFSFGKPKQQSYKCSSNDSELILSTDRLKQIDPRAYFL